MGKSKLLSCAIVLVTPDVKKTAEYYNEVLGFRVVEHFDHEEKFAACYRDNVEIVLVESQKGLVKSNKAKYGAAYDAYLVPEDVDAFYEELMKNGAKIFNPPAMNAYGSYEFKVEDIDGRILGIGRVRSEDIFFN